MPGAATAQNDARLQVIAQNPFSYHRVIKLASLPGLTRLDPAMHLFAKKMDPQVKPAGDVQSCVIWGLPQFMTQQYQLFATPMAPNRRSQARCKPAAMG
jgi:hypothetical protein